MAKKHCLHSVQPPNAERRLTYPGVVQPASTRASGSTGAGCPALVLIENTMGNFNAETNVVTNAESPARVLDFESGGKSETGGTMAPKRRAKRELTGATEPAVATSGKRAALADGDKPRPPRPTKAGQVLKKLRSVKGATIEMLVEATGWQAHSVRGFLSGTVRKKLGLTLLSEIGKDRVRRYRISDNRKSE